MNSKEKTREVRKLVPVLSLCVIVYMVTQLLTRYYYIGEQNLDVTRKAMQWINPIQAICFFVPVIPAYILGRKHGTSRKVRNLLAPIAAAVVIGIVTIIGSYLLKIGYQDTLMILLYFILWMLFFYVFYYLRSKADYRSD